MPEIVDWREPPEIVDWQQPPRRRRLFFLILAVIAVIVFFGRTALSYYVEALWFWSLGYRDVFRTTLSLQWAVFAAFTAFTFLILYGWFLALRWACRHDLPGGSTILIGGQRLQLPVDRILHLIGLAVSLVIAAVIGLSMMEDWSTFALYWSAPPSAGGVVDPILGKPINFYLFALPAWQSVSGWLLTLAAISCLVAGFLILVTGSTRALTGR